MRYKKYKTIEIFQTCFSKYTIWQSYRDTKASRATTRNKQMGPCHSLRRVHHSRGLGPRVGCPVACTVPLWLLSLSPCIAVKPQTENISKNKKHFRKQPCLGPKTSQATKQKRQIKEEKSLPLTYVCKRGTPHQLQVPMTTL